MLQVNRVQLFDGAMGTLLTNRPEIKGLLFEDLNIIFPSIIEGVHKQYVNAGSDFITTNTFGANRIKLTNSKYQLVEILDAAIENARRATQGTNCKVILDIGPSGKLMQPIGDLSFDQAYNNVKEVVELTASKVDGYLLETYADLFELKAAVLAVKENCSLPVFATMTFESEGRTLTGSTPEIVALTLTSLHVDALGLNCSTGPDRMVDFVKKMRSFTHLPIIVQPNKGLPDMNSGNVSYSFDDKNFASWMEKIVESGADIIGGCCGTTPGTISSIKHLKNTLLKQHPKIVGTYICSSTKMLKLEQGVICGERLNPTGKKKLQQALINHDFDYLQQEALRQENAHADFLDLNVGIPNQDEKQLLCEAVKKIQEVCDLPLQIDSAKPEAIEAAIRIYSGVPMINSVNGDDQSMAVLMPIIAKYGAVSVALTLDKRGIPATAEGRMEICKKIIAEAAKYGIDKQQLVFDALVMTISSNSQHGKLTLDTLLQLKSLGLLTIVGLSNVSFGLPQREYLNRTFLVMAMQNGLDMAIMNPNDSDAVRMVKAFCALSGNDADCAEYIAGANTEIKRVEQKTDTYTLHQSIIQGIKGNINQLVSVELNVKTPEEIINTILIPALTDVGKLFEEKKIFLPQLINSAETAKAVFVELMQHFAKTDKRQNKIILATVKGDIHDIGKNIVKIVLESHGFEVIDLGKDVDTEKIIEAFTIHNPDAIGLSALMTTTVEAMAITIEKLRKLPNICPIFVGGAVVTESIAKDIHADFYGADALTTVNKLESYFA